MPVDQKKLDNVIKLEKTLAAALKTATTLRATLEGELNPSPRALRLKEMVASAIVKRNFKLRKGALCS